MTLAKGKITVITPTIPPRGIMLGRASASVTAQKRKTDAHVVAIDWTGDGPGATRNEALRRVTTEWVAFLDDDDEFLEHHLRACEKMALWSGADLVYPIGRFDGAGDDPLRQMGQQFNPSRLRMGNFIPITTLARTELIMDAGGFPRGDEAPLMGAQRCEDWGLWLRLLDAGGKFMPLHQVTWLCHKHGGPYGNFSGRSWTPIGASQR
jgi:hypothetical protein